ncbi:MAG: methyltransferase domain-containing protein [Acidobacteria bacterium]|nr:methyltransferase domain-containing protein [Acidobacteriota bacterium]
MSPRAWFRCSAAMFLFVAISGGVLASQLASRPAPDWIARMERPERVAGLKIDYIIQKLELKPGRVVADLGAGPGVIALPMAKAVGPTGKVYAVDIDQAFIDHINMRAKEQNVTNLKAVLGKLTDPGLPAQDVDVALFHDVLHHIKDRAEYLKNTAKYVTPGGKIAIVDLDPKTGSHRNEPALTVSKDQAKAWLAAAGFKPVQEFDGLTERKWFVVYAR